MDWHLHVTAAGLGFLQCVRQSNDTKSFTGLQRVIVGKDLTGFWRVFLDRSTLRTKRKSSRDAETRKALDEHSVLVDAGDRRDCGLDENRFRQL